MGKFIDLTGQKFGRWTVIRRGENHIKPNGKSEVCWWCICDCTPDKEYLVMGQSLRNGASQSCGCLHNEKQKINNLTHGLSKNRIYKIWVGMKQRCTNVNYTGYNDYGGRGINICDDWLNSFYNFYCWAINNGYNNKLTLDRIDVNGNYCPENCRWTTNIQQQNNKRNTHWIEYNNEVHSLAEWSKIYNIPYKKLCNRITHLHWDFEKAITT